RIEEQKVGAGNTAKKARATPSAAPRAAPRLARQLAAPVAEGDFERF
ncbi:MAG: hypothetical protein HZB40_17015, partial [Rhodocyclales bacterium]|nr:hypothetical protein [Rhodocyclales bacterium]MBI5900908.1 hypothetical protein [Rhodocyclales bacterium]